MMFGSACGNMQQMGSTSGQPVAFMPSGGQYQTVQAYPAWTYMPPGQAAAISNGNRAGNPPPMIPCQHYSPSASNSLGQSFYSNYPGMTSSAPPGNNNGNVSTTSRNGYRSAGPGAVYAVVDSEDEDDDDDDDDDQYDDHDDEDEHYPPAFDEFGRYINVIAAPANNSNSTSTSNSNGMPRPAVVITPLQQTQSLTHTSSPSQQQQQPVVTTAPENKVHESIALKRKIDDSIEESELEEVLENVEKLKQDILDRVKRRRVEIKNMATEYPECCICLSSADNVAISLCKHVFCVECFTSNTCKSLPSYSQRAPTCPLCRTPWDKPRGHKIIFNKPTMTDVKRAVREMSK